MAPLRIYFSSFRLPDHNVWIQRLDCGLPFALTVRNAKVLGSINHDAMGIEWSPSSTVGVIGLFSEVLMAPGFYIFNENGNIGVTVWP